MSPTESAHVVWENLNWLEMMMNLAARLPVFFTALLSWGCNAPPPAQTLPQIHASDESSPFEVSEQRSLGCRRFPRSLFSCENRCGSSWFGLCWCDELCYEYGDCCEDYAAACGEPRSCGAAGAESCKASEYCAYEPGLDCGRTDEQSVCKTRPETCPALLDPVCGCDNKTYPNACQANQAGHGVLSKGPCKPAIGAACQAGSDQGCGEGQYCSYSTDANCGQAGASGTCQLKPTMCTTEHDPVCGCDEHTYSNPCDAAAAGVSVASKGACGSQPVPCSEKTGEACPRGSFCRYPANSLCGWNSTGVCTPQPHSCPQIEKPVCGCNIENYRNACHAQSEGVNVAFAGTCDSEALGLCGPSLQNCPQGAFCDYFLSSACGTHPDDVGVCRKVPKECQEQADSPVCGCDGKTYKNPCLAAIARVSIDFERNCSAKGARCGGLGGYRCKAGKFCNIPISGRCGMLDAPGNCHPIPETCSDVAKPVCGCNGKTYANACLAALAGVSLSDDKACPSNPG